MSCKVSCKAGPDSRGMVGVSPQTLPSAKKKKRKKKRTLELATLGMNEEVILLSSDLEMAKFNLTHVAEKSRAASSAKIFG